MPGRVYNKLYGLAEEQLGYFSAEQARLAGLGRSAIAKMQARGVVERVSRGVYRLSRFPVSRLGQYMEACLWPAGLRGVVSHESALTLYELSDVSPPTIQLTVPATFRVRRPVPAYLTVHHADLDRAEVETHEGILVTTAERAIRDCHAAHLGHELVAQAIDDAEAQGRLSLRGAARLRDALLRRAP
ncbi:MAG TPA: type IV toxin-antitoxin system AbiEi family antitoxin domain-containing protein [Myxococcota bacterium]|nr:type IV toxin-antitoxin system AbiEi family antitoxin domain-containing protein [Myxococcota bacterium]